MGNDNAKTHGVYAHDVGTGGGLPANLDDIIGDLEKRLQALGEYIDVLQSTGDTYWKRWEQVREAIGLQGQLASRIGRLLRDRQQLTGNQDDELQRAIDDALSAVGGILGLEL